MDGNVRRFIRVEDPVAVFLREVLPWHVDVVTKPDEDVSQLVPMPRRGVRGDGALSDRQCRIGDHRVLWHVVDPTDSVAFRASALDSIGRKVLCIEHRLPIRICTRAGVQHANQAGECRDASDR